MKVYSLTNNSITFEFIYKNKSIEIILSLPIIKIDEYGVLLKFENKLEFSKYNSLINLSILNRNVIDYFISLIILGFGIEINIEIENKN